MGSDETSPIRNFILAMRDFFSRLRANLVERKAHVLRLAGVIGGLLIVAVVVLGVTRCTGKSTGDGGASPAEAAALEASGFIEAQEVSVVSEVSGRVAEVLADEADSVSAGEHVVILDDSLLQADRARAEAAVAVTEANMAQLKAGADEKELAAAEATLNEAKAQLQGAQRAYYQAWAMVNNPRDIDVQIATAETNVELTARQIELLRVELDKARMYLGWLRLDDPLDERAVEFQEYTVQILEGQLAAAQAAHDGAVRKLVLLKAQKGSPLPVLAQAHQAGAQIKLSEAQVGLAQAQYDLLANGPLPQEIAMAEAQVNMAKAQVALIDAQLAQLTLVSPIDGVVTTRAIHPGETASPGVPLLTVANLDRLKLVIYIPETEIGRVQLGAQVEIQVDAYPNDVFEGVVTYISGEAEFTPRNVQTEQERVNLVFAVEIWIDNADGRLKPGMPADARIIPAD